MFDPKTLHDPGLAVSIEWVALYVAMLADVGVTRYGIWYRGFTEGNFIIKNKFYDLTKSAGGTFIDAMIRLGLVGVFIAAAEKFGVDYSPIPLLFAIPSVAMVVRNLILLKKK